MSKVSAYLQGHISGEVSTRSDERLAVMRDRSIIEQKPEIIVYPRTTNDLRKLARFSWQLAEKGHVLPVHIRGEGQGTTGASLGKGVVIDTSKHMNRIFEFEPKQKLVRAQPGTSLTALDNALGLQGVAVLPLVGVQGTLGGAVAEDAGGILSGAYGTVRKYVSQFEVVLDSGDLIQTGPLSRRELNHRKGLQGREGDIYRGVDAILEDHAEFIQGVQQSGTTDRSGYPGIFDVHPRNGAFDLTPLFIGSQGTLGLISEMILKTEYAATETSQAILLIDDITRINEILTILRKQDPSILQFYDGAMIREAARQGCNYEWLPLALDQIHAAVVIGFDDLNEHARERKIEKLDKLGKKLPGAMVVPQNLAEKEQVRAFYDIVQYSAAPYDGSETSAPAVIDGLYVPADRFEDLLMNLGDMASSAHIPLLIEGSALSSVYSVRPSLSMHRVSDKQKLLKLIDQINVLLDGLGGSLVGAGAEGRTLSHFARSAWNDEYALIVAEVKQVFDPYGIFNPDVKADTELKDIVKQLRADNGIAG